MSGIEIIKSIPWWVYFLGIYIGVSAYSSLHRRIVWFPLISTLPIALLGFQQYFLFASLSHEYQLIAILAFLVGVGLGGSIWRPTIIRALPAMRFELAGDRASAFLLIALYVVQVAMYVPFNVSPEQQLIVTCVSAFGGAFVAGSFVGRALFLFSRIAA